MLFIFAVIFCLLAIIISNLIIVKNTDDYLYSEISEVSYNKVGLLLGTSKYVADGRQNLFYLYRINAAEELYKNEKIDFILISGDNSLVEYNEPETMKQDLIDRGVLEERIYLDYAGFSTWDSIVRANKVFEEDRITIISQEFHNQRAVYIAQKNNIQAIGFNAQDVPVSRSLRVWLREKLARVKVIIDVLVNKQPKFLGEVIEIK